MLSKIFEKNSSENGFFHVGLSNLNKFLKKDNTYHFLILFLKNYYKNILVPGFIGDSFRTSKVYHKLYSVPVYGKFSELFFYNNTNYRTNDCIHSILVDGNYRFDEENHFNTFATDGCFSKLDRDNVTYVNIGTNELVSTQIHYVELINKLPYVKLKEYEGIIYYDEKNFEKITQINYQYKKTDGLHFLWNRKKIEKYLIKEGVLRYYNLNGLVIRFFEANNLRKAIELKIYKDPYYLIKY